MPKLSISVIKTRTDMEVLGMTSESQQLPPSASSAELMASPVARFHGGRFLVVKSEDLRSRPIRPPGLRLLAVEESVVVPQQIFQSIPGRDFLGRVVDGIRAELVVHLGVEVVHQELGPEIVELLHQPGGFTRVGALTLLQCLQSEREVRFGIVIRIN